MVILPSLTPVYSNLLSYIYSILIYKQYILCFRDFCLYSRQRHRGIKQWVGGVFLMNSILRLLIFVFSSSAFTLPFLIISGLAIPTQAYATTADNQIRNWDPELPTTPQKIYEMLRLETRYFVTNEEAGTCGGKVTRTKIADIRKYRDQVGANIFDFSLHFNVDKSTDYCKTITQTKCEASFSVTSNRDIANNVIMVDWVCDEGWKKHIKVPPQNQLNWGGS